MKKLFLYLLFCACFSSGIAQAQTITVTGSFNNIDPGKNYTYEANVTGLPAGAGAVSVSWSYVGRDESLAPVLSAGGAGTNGRTSIRWANTKHSASTQKSIKATVSWNVSGVGSSKAGDALPVTVNYVGAPVSMTIAGTNRSNGQNIDMACGTTPVTVSIPALETYTAGQPVTYTYTFPSGWTPASVTTTSTSTTSTPSAGGAGAIRVQAKITGQIYQSQIEVNVVRPQPAITSISTAVVSVCSDTETKPVTVVGTNAGQFIWTPSGGARVNGSSSPQTTTSSTANISSAGSGSFTVRAYSTACAVQSTSVVSAETKRLSLPDRSNLKYDYTNNAETYTHQVSSYDNHFVSFYTSDPTTITWNPIWSSGPQQGAVGVMRYDFILQPYQTLDFSPLTITNQCGTLSTTTSFQGIGPWLMSAYPNPATDVLHIEMVSSDQSASLPENAKLYSEKSGKVVKNVSFSKKAPKHNVLKISVSDLPRGTYYLEVIDEKSDKPAKKTRIILN